MSKDKPKGGLGKGLDILFGDSNMNINSDKQENINHDNTSNENTEKITHENVTELNPSNGESILFLEIDKIKTNPYQPRKEFEQSALEELAESIRQKGVIQAITVRRLDDGSYELISGERRLRASTIVGLEKIPAYVMDVTSKEDLLEIALIENIQRKDLNAIEVAEGYQRLITECSLTQEQVADKVSKSRSAVTNFLRMLKLPNDIRESIRKGEITEGHARAILALNDDVDQMLLWRKITGEKLSVRKAEEYTKKVKKQSKPRKIYEITDQNKAAINFLEEKFREHFGTKVRIMPSSKTTGQIVIEYFTAEDLERIIEMCKSDR